MAKDSTKVKDSSVKTGKPHTVKPKKAGTSLLAIASVIVLIIAVVFTYIFVRNIVAVGKTLDTLQPIGGQQGEESAAPKDIMDFLTSGKYAEATPIWLLLGVNVVLYATFFIMIGLLTIGKNARTALAGIELVLKTGKKKKATKENKPDAIDEALRGYSINPQAIASKNPVTVDDYKEFYQGKIFCGMCGSAMSIETGTKGGILIFCKTSLSGKGCDTPTISNDVFQQAFTAWYNKQYGTALDSFSHEAFSRSVKLCKISRQGIYFEGYDSVASANPSTTANSRNSFDY